MSNKLLSSFTVLLAFTLPAFSTDLMNTTPNPWKLQYQTGIGLTQSSYSDSWQGGEAGSVVWMANFLGQADRQLTPVWFSTNQLKLEFGQTHSQDEATKKWSSPRKSADKIRFDGLLRYTREWVVDPYAAITFESQFLDQSGSIDDRYVNPIDLTESVGIARTLFQVEDVRLMTTRIGLGFRQHLARIDDPMDSTKNTNDNSSSGGIEWVTDLTIGTAKSKVGFNSKLTVFQTFIDSKSEDLKGLPNENYWKTTDLNWDNTLRANLTSVLQMNLSWQLLYDKEIALSGRFKEALTLGLGYKFANFN